MKFFADLEDPGLAWELLLQLGPDGRTGTDSKVSKLRALAWFGSGKKATSADLQQLRCRV